MQSIKLNSEQKLSPLSQVFDPAAVRYFSELMLAAETTPSHDWGATDYKAAAAAGVDNAGVECASQCAYMPWLYTGCQNAPFNCRIVGGEPDPCTGQFPTAAETFPALTSTARGRALLGYPYNN